MVARVQLDPTLWRELIDALNSNAAGNNAIAAADHRKAEAILTMRASIDGVRESNDRLCGAIAEIRNRLDLKDQFTELKLENVRMSSALAVRTEIESKRAAVELKAREISLELDAEERKREITDHGIKVQADVDDEERHDKFVVLVFEKVSGALGGAVKAAFTGKLGVIFWTLLVVFLLDRMGHADFAQALWTKLVGGK